ncbi:hypothetical protein K438DRAFT_1750599 [Mycena galopus ATCC 62051]|nr:hypothetical protein K438DRAFT_1750599 [Mycena galopus ATCC 62051]
MPVISTYLGNLPEETRSVVRSCEPQHWISTSGDFGASRTSNLLEEIRCFFPTPWRLKWQEVRTVAGVGQNQLLDLRIRGVPGFSFNVLGNPVKTSQKLRRLSWNFSVLISVRLKRPAGARRHSNWWIRCIKGRSRRFLRRPFVRLEMSMCATGTSVVSTSLARQGCAMWARFAVCCVEHDRDVPWGQTTSWDHWEAAAACIDLGPLRPNFQAAHGAGGREALHRHCNDLRATTPRWAGYNWIPVHSGRWGSTIHWKVQDGAKPLNHRSAAKTARTLEASHISLKLQSRNGVPEINFDPARSRALEHLEDFYGVLDTRSVYFAKPRS